MPNTLLGEEVLLEEVSLQENLEDKEGCLITFGSQEPLRIWTAIALCAGLALPDSIPWRKALAEKVHK